MLYYRVERTPKEIPKKIDRRADQDEGVVFNANGDESELDDDEDGEQHITITKMKTSKVGQPRSTDLSKVQCYKCKQYGHYKNSKECPLYVEESQNDSDTDDLGDDEDDVIQVNVELDPDDFSNFVLVQFVNQSWQESKNKPSHLSKKVLLDNQANFNMFCNCDLLENIRKGSRTMTVQCQAGSTSTDLIR